MVIAPVAATGFNGTIGANATSNAAAVSSYEELLALEAENQILDIGSSGSGSGASDTSLLSADLLDLSPEALTILNGVGSGSGTATVTGTLTLGELTPTQQQQAASIVAEFAAEPATPQTFTQIENALTAAGINLEQLSVQQLIQAYINLYNPGFALNGQLVNDEMADALIAA